MREIFDEWQGGVMIGGHKVNNLRYADDTVVLASSKEELQQVMVRLKEISGRYGLKLNQDETKVMIVDGAKNNQPKVKTIAGYETVNQFNYLGSMITNSGNCEEEIRRRIAMGRTTTTKLTKIWTPASLETPSCETLVLPIATYASETWTVKKADAK